MSPPLQNAAICPTCGARIETTASGDFGCMACWLRRGLEETREAPFPEAPESLGTYRIMRDETGAPVMLGRGAMGVTYCAEDVSLQRKVALKVISADFFQHGAEARERFVREARAAASLHHPNVATVHQFGIDEETGQCFCAMELIEGETLDERVRRSGPLDLPTVLTIARRITAALITAEKHGIVHRDLKPGNIMIAESDEPDGFTIKIIDFGLAKALGVTDDPRGLTQGGFLGTPAFASPEQLKRAPVDARSDIYSLGATLWYLLTAQSPFGDRAPERPPIAQLKAARVPRPLISLLLAMLATEPAARPPAKEIAVRLDAMSPRGARWPLPVAAALLVVAFAFGFYLYHFRPPAPVQPATAPPGKSIAVLPFENVGEAKESATFADGVQDELLTDLARIADLKVVSRTSVMQYRRGQPRNLREIAGQLGVAYVVEGAVQEAGGRVRITAQLIDARTDLHRWAQSYYRPTGDIFAIQSEIAQIIADQLDAKISPHEKARIETPPTNDLTAFNLYTRANALLPDTAFSPRGKEKLLQAAQLLAEAVARDPKFLLAYCQLAKAHDSLYFLGFDRTQVRLSLGESAVKMALALNPDAGEAHLARARHLYQCYLAYEPALAELEIARRTLPNNTGVFTLAARIYRHEGKWLDSTREFENALALDPRNVDVLQQTAISYNLQRRYTDEAITLDKALTIAPQNIDLRITRALVELNRQADTRPLHALVTAILQRQPAAAPDLAGISLYLGLCERNTAEMQAALTALGDGAFGVDAIQFRRNFWEGMTARIKGDAAGAQRAFTAARAEQEGKVTSAPEFAPALCMLGVMDASLGHKSRAIEEGRRAVELLPVARDPVNGAHLIEFLALIYAWWGEPALACDQLEIATKIPGTLSYGQLNLSPMGDDLRRAPRYENIVAALAPEAKR
jgi:TolB-like protein/predicted Ser/Thr protein kinase